LDFDYVLLNAVYFPYPVPKLYLDRTALPY
jgi:hypothetical protein